MLARSPILPPTRPGCASAPASTRLAPPLAPDGGRVGGAVCVSARLPSSGHGHHHRDDTIQWGLAVPPASSPRSRDVNNATRAGLPHEEIGGHGMAEMRGQTVGRRAASGRSNSGQPAGNGWQCDEASPFSADRLHARSLAQPATLGRIQVEDTLWQFPAEALDIVACVDVLNDRPHPSRVSDR